LRLVFIRDASAFNKNPTVFMLTLLFRFLSYFPLPLLHAIGAALGWVVYWVSPSYRHQLQSNIRQAGFLSSTYRAVSEIGKSMFELPYIWYASPQRVFKSVTVEHWDVVEEALKAGCGVIFLTPHLGCFEVAAQAAAMRVALTALYRPPRKKILRPLIEDARTRANLTLAPANLAGVRTMLKALKRGETVGLLPDQVPQQGEGVWADFFKRPAYTMTLPAKLHSMTGAPIVLCYAERLSFGRGFVVRFVRCDVIDDTSSESQARGINLAMEGLIQQCPAQYLWSYNRYKIPTKVSAPPSVTSSYANE
jgi:KDO2-lipid IV(A) lauroyltransferase